MTGRRRKAKREPAETQPLGISHTAPADDAAELGGPLGVSAPALPPDPETEPPRPLSSSAMGRRFA